MFPTLTHWPSLRQAIALTAVIAATCAAAPAADLPNIILLMGDDHGWDETGYNWWSMEAKNQAGNYSMCGPIRRRETT